MAETQEYIIRADPDRRKRQGGVWTPKNEDGVGFFASLSWHRVEITEKFAERLSESPNLQVYKAKAEKGEKGHPTKQKSWDKDKVVSHKNTAWSVPNSAVRRKATDAIFETELSGETEFDQEVSSGDDEVIPDNVSEVLGEQVSSDDLSEPED